MDPNSLTLPVHERFLTFQGEGVHAGRKAFFIRTFGCPVQCPWCDSAGTWHKDFVPSPIERPTFAKLVEEVVEANPAFVVLTGGEPMIHPNLHILSAMIRKEGYPVHVETCGAFSQDQLSAFDWFTVSPKVAKMPLRMMLHCASEFKLIVDSHTAIGGWVRLLEGIAGVAAEKVLSKPIWLHPEWSKREDQATLDYITKEVTERGDPFRAGWQMHKLYRADALDPRAAKLAPLGGNPALGY